MNARPPTAVDPTMEFAKIVRVALVTVAFGATLASSSAHAGCMTRNLGGGFVSYSCSDGKSGTTIVPRGPSANQGSTAPRLPSTNTGIGINKELFGNRSGISQGVGPNRSIHLYGGRTGSSVGRGGGITTHSGPAFESETTAPRQAAPKPAHPPEVERSSRPIRRR